MGKLKITRDAVHQKEKFGTGIDIPASTFKNDSPVSLAPGELNDHVISEEVVAEFQSAYERQIQDFIYDAQKAIIRELEYFKRRRSVFCFDEYPRDWVLKLVESLKSGHYLCWFEEIGGREHVITKK